jgi:hypothetical protein
VSVSLRLTSLRDFLCEVPRYLSAQPLDILDLAENLSFMNWRLTVCPTLVGGFVDVRYTRFSFEVIEVFLIILSMLQWIGKDVNLN